jgi:hypothetical protein
MQCNVVLPGDVPAALRGLQQLLLLCLCHHRQLLLLLLLRGSINTMCIGLLCNDCRTATGSKQLHKLIAALLLLLLLSILHCLVDAERHVVV